MTSIAALKSAANLREIIAEHVELKRGRGLCPFHAEKTPSFAIHPGPSGDHWRCYGCGLSGDVIDFTARINGISKGRAITLLAERYGVPVTRQTRMESAYTRDLREQAEFWWARRRAVALDCLEAACEAYFAGMAPESLPAAACAALRTIDSISGPIHGTIFLRLRTSEDNRIWRERKESIAMIERVIGKVA